MAELNPFQHIALAHLAPSPTNPRKTFADLEELAASIREQGVMQPILVRVWPDDYATPEGRTDRPRYEIIAGERRYRAAQLAALAEIPALVRPLNTRQVLEAQIVENLQRRDVTELEEADGYQLMMRDHGYTAEQLAEKVGKSRAYIYGRLKLCGLCEACKQLYRDGKLDASRALLIARIPVPDLQVKAATEIIREGSFQGRMSAREAANHIQNHYTLDLTKAPFGMDEHIVAVLSGMAGTRPVGLIPCTECPSRTGNAPELYPGVGPDVCTDPTCFADKRAANLAKQAEAEKAQGRKVITGDAAKKIAPHGIYNDAHGDYIALDEKAYYGGDYKTAREALKGQDVPIVMVEDHRKGTLVPMAAKKDLNEALRAHGIKIGTSNRDPRDLAREKARKLEIQYRRSLFDAHHAAARTTINAAPKPTLKRPDLALIARQFWAARGNDACKRLARVYIPEAPERGPDDSAWQDDDYRRTRRMTAMIDEFNEAQLILFLLDLALIGTLDVPTYLNDIDTPSPLLEAVQRAGVEPQAIKTAIECASVKTASTPQQAAPAAIESAPKLTEGTRVRVRPGACWDNGTPIASGDMPATIVNAVADGYGVRFDDGTQRTYLPASALEPISPSSETPIETAPQAAPASEKPSQKAKGQAAAAARTTKAKTKTSGRVTAAREEKESADGPLQRCPKTRDMLEGVTP